LQVEMLICRHVRLPQLVGFSQGLFHHRLNRRPRKTDMSF
jgi:hypothetical protein